MAARTINIEALHQKLKKHPRSHEMGMIASHRGIVRGTSRQGAAVSGLFIEFDTSKVNDIINSIRQRPGIIEVLAEFNEGGLTLGEDVMVVVVAGDIRDNVFPALEHAVNELKKRAAKKEEQISAE